MFGWSVHVMATPTRLVVTDPISIIAVVLILLFLLGPICWLAVQRPLPVKKIIGFAVVLVIVLGFALDCARVTLDKTAGTMTIQRFALYHLSTQTEPLTALSRAYLTTGATTARITLQMQNGQTYSLSSNNQMGGKPAAVQAINNFIGTAQ